VRESLSSRREAEAPRVTIGVPVFNGGPFLRTVLESLLAQSYQPFKLVISDNASTDVTEGICREFAQRDDRVVYVRQQSNIGASDNFIFVLAQADTEYFMWAAADDLRSPDFLEKNVQFLDGRPDFLGSTCPVRYKGREFDAIRMGDQTLDDDDRHERLIGFFRSWHANGRFYSVFRTAPLRRISSSNYYFLGADWTIILELLSEGKLNRLDSGFVELGRQGVSSSPEIFARFRRGLKSWAVPFWEMSLNAWGLFRNARLSQKARLLGILVKLNALAFKLQIKFELKRRYLRSL
jgi:glycosyltransferase involved in cell wall biosynthesis